MQGGVERGGCCGCSWGVLGVCGCGGRGGEGCAGLLWWWLLWLLVFVVVDVVHQSHELGDRLIELDVGELLLLDAQYRHAEREDALHVRVVVRDVELGLRHVVFDKVVRLGHQMPSH